jgi:hypothetical protein
MRIGVTCKQKVAGLSHIMDGILYRILNGILNMVNNRDIIGMLFVADNIYPPQIGLNFIPVIYNSSQWDNIIPPQIKIICCR